MYLRKTRSRKSRKSCRSFNSPSIDYAQKKFAKDYSRLETIDGLVDASDGEFFSKCAFPGFCHDEDHIQIFDNHQVRKKKNYSFNFFLYNPSVQHRPPQFNQKNLSDQHTCQFNTRKSVSSTPARYKELIFVVFTVLITRVFN